MKQWHILHNKGSVTDVDELLKILLKNRDISEKDKVNFINPDIDNYSYEEIGLVKSNLEKSAGRIKKGIENKEKIIIFGDYDVDGICASAILWETLFSKSDRVLPYIPGRIEEGYGLSVKGIENVLKDNPDTSLIITVDNGIVAFDAINFANEKGIDVVVTDHHARDKKEPEAYCILHTTQLCGAGIAWFLAAYLGFETKNLIEEKLELACLATIADLVPLKGASRAIVKKGIEILKKTKRAGLIELMREAGLDKDSVGVYSIGHVIAPRLNATGRINTAMEALRLICTKNSTKAKQLALTISSINRDRQDMTGEAVGHAKMLAIQQDNRYVTVVAHKTYNQGVIGLIASQLVESYYKPAFAIAVGESVSKGSARSIKGVNIIELLRSVNHTLLEVGGHPMAAGFSLETTRIDEFMTVISNKAKNVVSDDLLNRTIDIDCEIPFSLISVDLVQKISDFAPFGMGNPEPVFSTKKVYMREVNAIGKEKSHLKMKIESEGKIFDAVAFGMAGKVDLESGDTASIAYTVDENEWNGRKSLQLKLRDINTA